MILSPQSLESGHRAGESVPGRHAEVCRAGEEGEGEGGEGEEDEQQGHRDLGPAIAGKLIKLMIHRQIRSKVIRTTL